MKKRILSGIKTARTRTFPSAGVGSDHDMVMRTFPTHLKKSSSQTKNRIIFDTEKLNDPTVMSAFQATIGGRFAPLATLVDEDADLDSMVTDFNKAVTDTAEKIIAEECKLVSEPEGAPQNKYLIFIDLRKAFDIVRHEALWATTKKYNINANITRVINQNYQMTVCVPFKTFTLR